MNIGYCTNIHSGVRFEQTLENLRLYAQKVKQATSPSEPMGIGLWFSEQAATEALQTDQLGRLKACLSELGLSAYTFNAFPQFDFHQDVVKKSVYLPDWTSSQRLQYTLSIAKLQSELLPAGSVGTISTVPLGWRNRDREEFFRSCAAGLKQCAEALHAIYEDTGVKIRLCLEPEPGCALQVSSEVCDFFQRYLFDDSSTVAICQSHLAVCHDICHAAVMMESQSEVLNSYLDLGLNIAKVQISSAPQFIQREKASLPNALARFVEPRYMHQTTIQRAEGNLFYDDLPAALAAEQDQFGEAVWRIHFHVPIMLDSIEDLQTTQDEITQCLNWFVERDYQSHFEVETYAWEVSPSSVRDGGVVDSIVAELQWLRQRFPGLAKINRT